MIIKNISLCVLLLALVGYAIFTSENVAIFYYAVILWFLILITYIKKLANPLFIALLSYQFLQIFSFIVINHKDIKLDTYLQYENYIESTLILLNLIFVSLIAITYFGKNFTYSIKCLSSRNILYIVILYFTIKFLYIIFKYLSYNFTFFIILNNIIIIILFLSLTKLNDNSFKSKWPIPLIFIIEIISGFYEYSSHFKNCILIYSIILICEYKLKIKSTITIVLLVLLLGSFWEVNKADYRNFQNNYQTNHISQKVNQNVFDSYSFLISRAANFGADEFVSGFGSLFSRISYVEPMANAKQIAGEVLGLQDGLIERILYHISHPRLFYPDKKDLDDSIESNLFIEYFYAGNEQGVSASLGYLTQIYINFPSPFLYLTCFFIWLLFCQIFMLIIKFGESSLLAYALAINIFYSNFLLMETSIVKIIGGVFSYTILSLAVIFTVKLLPCKLKIC
jgi:hypothetical protein